MSTSKNRRLAAILFADIVGYTALMQKDEITANQNLEKFHQTLNEKVNRRGRSKGPFCFRLKFQRHLKCFTKLASIETVLKKRKHHEKPK